MEKITRFELPLLKTKSGAVPRYLFGTKAWGGFHKACPPDEALAQWQHWSELRQVGISTSLQHGYGQSLARWKHVMSNGGVNRDEVLLLSTCGKRVVTASTELPNHGADLWRTDSRFQGKSLTRTLEADPLRGSVNDCETLLGCQPDGQALLGLDSMTEANRDEMTAAVRILHSLRESEQIRYVGIRARTDSNVDVILGEILEKVGDLVDFIMASGHTALDLEGFETFGGKRKRVAEILLPLCQEKQVRVVNCTTLGGNALSLTRQQLEETTGCADVTYGGGPINSDLYQRLMLFHKICETYEENPLRVALWAPRLLTNGQILFGIESVDQLTQNIELLEGQPPKLECLEHLQLERFLHADLEICFD